MMTAKDVEQIRNLCGFNPDALPAPVQSFLQKPGMDSLGPGRPDPEIAAQLQALTPEQIFASKPRDQEAASACLAGILLYHNVWEKAHKVAQNISSAEGSYWHAIIHRREPDAWNSKYWFGRVGQHAIYPQLLNAARALAAEFGETSLGKRLQRQEQWDAFAFVDACEEARGSKRPEEKLCLRIQLAEWMLLFQYCYQKAAP